MKKGILSAICLFVIQTTFASEGAFTETMYKSGKIYTFLLVAFIVLTTIAIYLIRLDIKLTKLENKLNEKGGEEK